MIKNILKGLSMCTMALLSASCLVRHQTPIVRAQEFQPQIDMPTSVVVCRSKQCAPAKLSSSKEYIYNSLAHMLEQNATETALVCQADPFTHTCTEDYLTLPITVGVTPAHMYISDVQFEDISIALKRQSIDLILNYGVSYNGQKPVCKPAKTLVYVKNSQNIIMEDAGYMCKMTTIGNTTIKTLFAIDYIDLDYGFIGGYYSIGLSGPAYGGRSGYMLFRLKNDAYPLSPDLILKEKSKKAKKKPTEQALQVLEQPVVFEGVPCDAQMYQCPPKELSAPAQTPIDTNDVPSTVEESTVMSVYETPSTQSEEGMPYNGVEVFPIYKKQK
ncbi:MAG: hypothetical protein J5895_00485 [Alphaproteobacteria bacterium]|nr:hypothetical protein [Alphaproteobacteria bacterium]